MYGNDLVSTDYEERSLKVYKQCTYDRNYMDYEVVLCLLGMINTAVIMAVFTRPHMRRSSMNFLLVAMEISNFVSIAAHLLHVGIAISCPAISPGTTNSALLEFALSLHVPSINFANMITPLIGVWRFTAVTWPIQAKRYLTRNLAIKMTIVVVVISTLYSLYIYLYHSVERSPYTEYQSDPSTCFFLPSFTDLVEDFKPIQCRLFDRNVFLSIGVLVSVVPCVVSFIVNLALICGLIVKKCEQSRLKEGQKTTSFSQETKITCTLVVFLLAHVTCYVCPDLFTAIVYMCSTCQIQNDPVFCFLFYHFPAVIYLSFLAFFCYCIMSKNFRDTVWNVLKLDALLKIISCREEYQLKRKSVFYVGESDV